MARQAGTFVENQYAKGLVTEATGFNFPEKAAIEAWNCRFTKIGEVERRKGFDAEDGNVDVAGVFRNGATRSFIWKNPGTSDKTFLVTQTGQSINFFEPDNNGYFSNGLKAFDFLLSAYKTEGSATDVGKQVASFAAADGRLFIVHPKCDCIVVEYDEDLDDITISTFLIEIRDFEGVDDSLEPDERPDTLSAAHNYNLKNQGWWPEAGTVELASNLPAALSVIEAFKWKTKSYPSNSEIWWYYKTADEQYEPQLYRKKLFGNSEAPKGHYIYHAFDIDRESISGISGVENYITTDRPSTIAFYAGRTWFGGIDDKIYYSQVIRDQRNWGHCYQQNDPTSENLSDLLDTDGGVIKIFGMGRATAMFSSVNNLYVFATNGIWVISGSGSEGTGFVATDFAVRRISTVNLLSSDSLVDVEGSPVWWNIEGIWGIQQTQTGGIDVVSLTNDTIKTFLDDNCPEANRQYAQGAYNPSERIVQWLFRSSAAASVTGSYQYDRILEFNVTTGAFYPHKWNGSDLYLRGIFCASGVRTNMDQTENVVDNNGVVVTSSAANVTVLVENPSIFANNSIKYFSFNVDEITILAEQDVSYTDFDTILGTGVDYSSYFITGAKIHGEGRSMNVEYITVFCKELTDASVKLSSRWDWANAGASGKWSTPQECYTVNRNNRDVSRKRLLIRGTGPAVQFYWASVSGKPFNVLGWSAFETVDAVP